MVSLLNLISLDFPKLQCQQRQSDVHHVYLEPRYQLFRDGLLDQSSQSTAGRFLHMLVVVQDMLQQALHHEKRRKQSYLADSYPVDQNSCILSSEKCCTSTLGTTCTANHDADRA